MPQLLSQFGISQIKNKLVKINPLPYIASFFQTEIREEILKNVDTRLLYFNKELIDLETKKTIPNVENTAESLAQASKSLLSAQVNKKQQSIALFLPLTEFIYTKYSLPSVDSINIKSALRYQQSELLPASDDNLQLTVQHLHGVDNFALWYSTEKLEQLHQAFEQSGLLLSSVLPRFTLKTTKEETPLICENSKSYYAQFAFKDYALSELRHITQTDSQDELFKQQWEQQFSPIETKQTCLTTQADWLSTQFNDFSQSSYAFFPKKIIKGFKSSSRLKNSRVIGLLAFIFIFVAAIPFIINEVRYYKYEKKYQVVWEQASEVRKQRSDVINIEDQWALYANFPNAGALDIIIRLNKIIPLHSWISSFQIKNGYVEIDGYSPNPAEILEIISSQQDFNEVAFNQQTRAERGKTKERFGITFHIKDLDIENYEKEYFEVE